MIPKARLTVAGVLAGLLILFVVQPAQAFPGFDDGGGGGLSDCASCHGSLANEGPGHDAHQSLIGGCSSCHGSGGRNNPPLANCVQCHGRDQDAGGDNVSAGLGRGLRLHHVAAGVACGNCHSDALGAVGVGENVFPSFYATAGLDACDGSEERFASLTVSLDNDGDGLTDGNDPDCGASLAPNADAGGPYSGLVGTAVNFDGTASSDPDGTVVSYAWDFGDGGTATGASPSHSYAADGVFTVTLTVTDNDGLTGADTTTATITPAGGNMPPVAQINGPYSGTEGVAVQFSSDGSIDPDGAIVSYAWDFGDGNTSSSSNPEHTYVVAGTYNVSLTVTDDAGQTDSASSNVTITEPAPASDGESQYGSYCASCHGDPWSGPAVDPDLSGAHRVTGARSCTIEASIFGTSVFPNGVPDMQFLQGIANNGSINSEQIADYLNSQSVTGEQRYVSACAGCHGDDGRGGRVGEGVLGESAGEIRSAISGESTMRFLACLPDSDINSIAAYLGASGGGETESESEGGGSSDLVLLAFLALFGLRRVAAQSRDSRR